MPTLYNSTQSTKRKNFSPWQVLVICHSVSRILFNIKAKIPLVALFARFRIIFSLSNVDEKKDPSQYVMLGLSSISYER